MEEISFVPHEDFDALEFDSEVDDPSVFHSDEAYQKALEEKKNPKEKVEETPKVEEVAKIDDVEIEEVAKIDDVEIENAVEFEVDETEKPSQEKETDERFQKLKAEGKIPAEFNSWEEFVDSYTNINTIRGKHAAEVGKLRKLTKAQSEQLKSLTEEYEKVAESVPKITDEDILFFGDIVPTGVKEGQIDVIKNVVENNLIRNLSPIFNKRGVEIPKNQEDWDSLKLDNPELYENAQVVRKNLLRTELQRTKEYNTVVEAYPVLYSSAITEADSDLKKYFEELGTPITEEDMEEFDRLKLEAEEFVKTVVNSPDSGLYLRTLPTGHKVPRPDMYKVYLQRERGDLIKTLSEAKPENSVKEVEVKPANSERENTQKLQTSLKGLQTFFQDQGLQKFTNPSFKEEVNAIIAEIWKDKSNTLYWDGDVLRDNALKLYYLTHKERDLFEEIRSKALNNGAERTQRVIEERLERTPEPNRSIATRMEEASSKSSDSVGLPSPEEFNNTAWTLKQTELYAKQNGLDLMAASKELFEKWAAKISKLSESQQEAYNGF